MPEEIIRIKDPNYFDVDKKKQKESSPKKPEDVPVSNPTDMYGDYLFQRTYRLSVGSPRTSAEYEIIDSVMPVEGSQARYKLIPNTSGGSIDLKDKKSYTPVDTSNFLTTPYVLSGMELYQDDEIGFKINFVIGKNDKSTANKAEVRVYNPPLEFVESANKDKAILRLYAGYLSTIEMPRLILCGNIEKTNYTDDGAETVLSISVSELGSNYISRWFTRVYSENTPVYNIVNDLVDHIVKNDITIESKNVQWSNRVAQIGDKVTYAKDAFTILEELCAQYGYAVYISNGIINVRFSDVYSGTFKQYERVVPLSSKNGLVGRPKFVIDKKNSLQSINKINFKCLLNPLLDIGVRVILSSKALDKPTHVIITNVIIKGDSYAGEWCSECEGIVVAPLSLNEPSFRELNV